MRERRGHSKPTVPARPADSDESPENVKRDGKPATERRIPAVHDPEASLNPSDNDRGRRRRLQDPLPLEETPRGASGRPFPQQQQSVVVAETEPVDVNANTVPVNPTHIPRSGYYFQHDDRSGVSAGRSHKRRASDRGGWTEPRVKARYDERPRETSPSHQGRRKDKRHLESSEAVPRTKAEDAWTHDKFLESQAEELERGKKQAAPLERARHAVVREFKEKLPVKSENAEEQKGGGPDMRSERRCPDMNLAWRERERYREKVENLERGRWMESDRKSGRYHPQRGYSRYMGDGERLGGRFDLIRRNSGSNVVVADRWTHDRFEELNHSPTPKQEEDTIAQIEALLAA